MVSIIGLRLPGVGLCDYRMGSRERCNFLIVDSTDSSTNKSLNLCLQVLSCIRA